MLYVLSVHINNAVFSKNRTFLIKEQNTEQLAKVRCMRNVGYIYVFSIPQDRDVDSLVNEFTNIIIKVSRKVIEIKNRRFSKKKQRSTMENKKWIDKSCHLLKNELRNLGSLLSRFPDNNFLRLKFFSTKKEYKRLVKRRIKKKF